MTPLLHPAADEEFAAAVRYYADISPELGVRFYREMERLLQEVCTTPERFWDFDPPARRHLSPNSEIGMRKLGKCPAWHPVGDTTLRTICSRWLQAAARTE